MKYMSLVFCGIGLGLFPFSLYGQELEWRQRKEGLPAWIESTAEFAMLEVPEHRKTQSTNKVVLAIARARAKNPSGKAPIVYLAGGPGSSAINMSNARYMAPLFQKLHEHHDLIFMDQRGTGRSKPNLSFPAKDGLPEEFFVDATVARTYFRELHGQAKQHFVEQGIDLRAYNSLESANDLESLRKALGAKKLILLGFSYGTHLGQTMLKYHPESVERAILVGCEGLDETMKLPSTYSAQLSQLAQLAAVDPKIGSAVPDLEGLVDRVLSKLAKKPVTVPVKNRRGETLKNISVGKFGLQLILRLDIGDGNDFPDFPRMLHALDQGNVEPLTAYVSKRYFQFSRGINVMTTVMDLASGVSPDRMQRIERENQECFLHPIVNLGFEDHLGLYPKIDLGPSFRAPFYSKIPTLFISGQLDSNTPPFQAQQLRWRFSRGVHVILEYGGHEDMLPHPKIQQLMVDFVTGKPVKDQIIYQDAPKFRSLD